MKTIVMASQKGGSGKTTLSLHLAVEAERVGRSAWLIDTDKQGSLTRWHDMREADTPQRAEMPFSRIADGLKQIEAMGGDYCIIDTAPTISDQSKGIIDMADLVLIPVGPSPVDIWSAGETVEVTKAAGKPFMFIVTLATPQANLTAQTVAALSQHGRVAKTFIAKRVLYAGALVDGHSAPEIEPNGPAAKEIAALWAEVESLFHERKKSGRKAVTLG